MSKQIVELYQYSDKYIVVFGNTKDYKSHFVAAGGQFRLSFKLADTKGPGWGFFMSLKPKVEKLINDINNGVIKPTPQVADEPKMGSSAVIDDKAFNILLKRIEFLEQEVALLRGCDVDNKRLLKKPNCDERKLPSSNYEEEEPEYEDEPQRLLPKKNKETAERLLPKKNKEDEPQRLLSKKK